MNQFNTRSHQGGVALVVSLLFLLVVTLISITAATNSSQGLKMASNMQDNYNSFQSAEAGILAAISLASSPVDDPFKRAAVIGAFDGPGINSGNHPLRNLRDGTASVVTLVYLTAAERDCPRPPGARGGSSVGLLDCDYYRIESEHDVAKRARSKIHMGVVKTVIGASG